MLLNEKYEKERNRMELVKSTSNLSSQYYELVKKLKEIKNSILSGFISGIKIKLTNNLFTISETEKETRKIIKNTANPAITYNFIFEALYGAIKFKFLSDKSYAYLVQETNKSLPDFDKEHLVNFIFNFSDPFPLTSLTGYEDEIKLNQMTASINQKISDIMTALINVGTTCKITLSKRSGDSQDYIPEKKSYSFDQIEELSNIILNA